jgi:hypothetical protein
MIKLELIVTNRQKLIKLLTCLYKLHKQIAIKNVSKLYHVHICKNGFKYVENI